MGTQTGVLLKKDCKPEALEFMQILNEMPQAEQKEMLVFMHGVKFAKALERKTTIHSLGE